MNAKEALNELDRIRRTCLLVDSQDFITANLALDALAATLDERDTLLLALGQVQGLAKNSLCYPHARLISIEILASDVIAKTSV